MPAILAAPTDNAIPSLHPATAAYEHTTPVLSAMSAVAAVASGLADGGTLRDDVFDEGLAGIDGAIRSRITSVIATRIGVPIN
ncbi:hypothetical protein [Streptomyces sp. 13-12-16]|uniref:hypothetical protein n=1 Tax=Streptomyces sp. 13-12-16 TaxID=1570823 RepID=UPI000A1ED7F7|nr:hypothetical protein [Streptomyces sp. 13-12-16]